MLLLLPQCLADVLAVGRKYLTKDQAIFPSHALESANGEVVLLIKNRGVATTYLLYVLLLCGGERIDLRMHTYEETRKPRSR